MRLQQFIHLPSIHPSTPLHPQHLATSLQVILLNLLIAIMGDSTHRNIRGADLVARYQRAQLIVEIEPSPTRAHSAKANEFHSSRTSTRRITDRVSAAASAVKHLLLLGTTDTVDPHPKWLHVLAPAEGKQKHIELDMEKELNSIHQALHELQKHVDAMPAAVERQMRLAKTGHSSHHL